jgi:hypothetical protein
VQYGLGVVSVAGDLLALSDRGAGVPLRELALVGLTAAIITYFATGPVRLLATRFGAVAYPRERDVHVTPTPRMGGLAMYVGVMAGTFLASQLPALTRGFVYSSGMPAVAVATAVILAIGLIDDRWGLDALTKFAGQITAASVLVTMGVAWSVLYIPLGGVGTIVLDQASSMLLTLALTVSIVNAMNFVDGRPRRRRAVLSAGGHLGGAGRSLPRFFAAQLPSGPDFHGRLRIHADRFDVGRGIDDGRRADFAERLRRPRCVRLAVTVPAGGGGDVRPDA